MAVSPTATSNRTSRRLALKLCLLSIGLLLAVILAGGDPARADEKRNDWPSTSPRLFKICKDQTYALCAVADCTVFNGVSYCKCDVMSGDSISLPFNFDDDQDICSVNAEGKNNGYMASTYSLPQSVVAPEGDQALYNCPAATSTGAYAQCDGGLCFTSTEGQSFPGFDQPLKKGELICSCPITVADPETAKTGYQIAGPYPCEAAYFQNCGSETANTSTGAMIHVGSPTGAGRLLTRRLYGQVPPLHECRP